MFQLLFLSSKVAQDGLGLYRGHIKWVSAPRSREGIAEVDREIMQDLVGIKEEYDSSFTA